MSQTRTEISERIERVNAALQQHEVTWDYSEDKVHGKATCACGRPLKSNAGITRHWRAVGRRVA